MWYLIFPPDEVYKYDVNVLYDVIVNHITFIHVIYIFYFSSFIVFSQGKWSALTTPSTVGICWTTVKMQNSVIPVPIQVAHLFITTK